MNSIKFLGTSGGRFVLIRQIRKSGGIWFNFDNTNFLIDPGPGSLINSLNSKPKLNPRDLDGIILTHRHLDHSNDVNLMIEAMTNGGWDKKGIIFAPSDALYDDPVILEHFRNHVDKIEILKEKGTYKIGNIRFETPVKHIHGVEAFGLNIYHKNYKISLITDTKYFENIESFYEGDIIIIHLVMFIGKDHILHLDYKDVKKILSINKPKLCILTHFGLTMIKANPNKVAKKLKKETGVNVIAAHDGLTIDLDKI